MDLAEGSERTFLIWDAATRIDGIEMGSRCVRCRIRSLSGSTATTTCLSATPLPFTSSILTHPMVCRKRTPTKRAKPQRRYKRSAKAAVTCPQQSRSPMATSNSARSRSPTLVGPQTPASQRVPEKSSVGTAGELPFLPASDFTSPTRAPRCPAHGIEPVQTSPDATSTRIEPDFLSNYLSSPPSTIKWESSENNKDVAGLKRVTTREELGYPHFSDLSNRLSENILGESAVYKADRVLLTRVQSILVTNRERRSKNS